MSGINKNDDFLTQREREITDFNMELRMQMIESITKQGIPEKVGDLRVLKEIIESADNKAIELAKLRLKYQENTTNENMAEVAAELLKAVERKKNDKDEVYIPRNVEIDDKIVDTVEVVDGELELNPPTLTIDDIKDD